MTNDQHELRRVNWTEVFAFTHIFKSFEMARHPSKLLLSLGAVVTIFCLGWVMDSFWTLPDQYVYQNEIFDHFTQQSGQFSKAKQARLDSRLDRAASMVAQVQSEKHSLSSYKFKLPAGDLRDAFSKALTKSNEGKTPPTPRVEEIRKGKDYDDLLDDAETLHEDMIERIEDQILRAAKQEASGAIKAIDDARQRENAQARLDEDLTTAKQAITRMNVDFAQQVYTIQGGKIFASLTDYERRCLNNALTAVRHGNIFGGLQDYRTRLKAKAIGSQTVRTAQAIGVATPVPSGDRPGFFYWALLAVHALVWLVCEHWVYALIFLILGLGVVAFFGGAVHRISALHFAREEKISLTQALKFSCSRFLSFFTAPLIPLAFILVIAGLLALGGLVGSFWYVGEVLMGVLFFLAIAGGLVIALMGIGLVGGFPLMYPTIAVEGSDSFDAISRSFNYIFARPWRSALYGLVALVYGTVTYLFVRFIAYLALSATHVFVKWGIIGYGDRLHGDADKLDVLWTAPTFDSLFGPFNWEAMTGAMPVVAWLIGLWVFLVAAAVTAYLLSYAASATTIIYCLLRRKVDATDLDDVYVEEAEEEELIPTEAPEAAEAQAGEAPSEQAEAQAPEEPTAEQAEEQSSEGEQPSEGEGEGESPPSGPVKKARKRKNKESNQ